VGSVIDRDGFITFCPVYVLKHCAADRDDDDTHILYILLLPSHPVRLVADLVDFDLNKLSVGMILLVAGQGVLCIPLEL
jgi:hypothetical protein